MNRVGVAYYPEHWDESMWRVDLENMREVGIGVVRIGEFAWSELEPEEGVFEIGFFDKFLELCKDYGIKVIFGTPTATPPVWMQTKYPDILNYTREGNAIGGPRRNYNYNSPTYNKFAERIVEKLAEHLANKEVIIGWQIDNELNCGISDFFSPSDSEAFREYLREKFSDVDELNSALGLTFWSRRYSKWDEVRLERPALHNTVHPSLRLEEKRFFSASAIGFAARQARILRRHISPDVFITTNGLFGNLEYHKLLGDALDFVSYDSYPNFGFDISVSDKAGGDFPDRKWSRNLMWTRSISSPFAIMEQQVGPHGWTSRMETPSPRPGQVRLWTYQSIAHGANFVSYFRWRTSPFGAEIYWTGINDSCPAVQRRVDEVRQIAGELNALPDDFWNATCRSEIGVIRDYDNEFDAEVDNWHSRLSAESDKGIFWASQFSHTPYDFVYLSESSDVKSLSEYRVLIYPHGYLLDDSRADLLKEYVKRGGTLVLGAQTGLKDMNGKRPIRNIPGFFDHFAGVVVEDYTLLDRSSRSNEIVVGTSVLDAPVFNEILKPEEGTSVLGRYSKGYYAGRPAITLRQVGEGKVVYVGSCFSEELAGFLLSYLEVASPFSEQLSLTSPVELVVRSGGGRKWFILLNYSDKEQNIEVRGDFKNVLPRETVRSASGDVLLPPFGVAILQGRM